MYIYIYIYMGLESAVHLWRTLWRQAAKGCIPIGEHKEYLP